MKASYWWILVHSVPLKVWMGAFDLMIRSCQKWRESFTIAFSINLNTINVEASHNLLVINLNTKR